MTLRISPYIWFTIALVSILPGCKVHYEPLKSSSPSLEANMLEGNMASYWHSNIEPAVQNECMDCHSSNDENMTPLQFQVSPANNDHSNLASLLLLFQQNSAVNLQSLAHHDIDFSTKEKFTEFETYAALYWNWQDDINTARTLANDYFISDIEDTIIQPVCTGCHVFLEGNNEPFAGTLSFYNYKNEDHGSLNSLQAINYLLVNSQTDLIYSKALGTNHGGATVIQRNTVESDTLLQHSLLAEDVFQLIENPPY